MTHEFVHHGTGRSETDEVTRDEGMGGGGHGVSGHQPSMPLRPWPHGLNVFAVRGTLPAAAGVNHRRRPGLLLPLFAHRVRASQQSISPTHLSAPASATAT